MAIHLINAGGKRVRPALSITTSLISENEPASVDHDVIRGGVAVELVHQGSLYHDDVMDGAKTRRNVESVNSLIQTTSLFDRLNPMMSSQKIFDVPVKHS